MKTSSGEIRKGSNSKYLVCLDTSHADRLRYVALNLRTGAVLPINKTFIKSTVLESIQVLVKNTIKIINVSAPVYYAVVNHGIVERISFEKFELRCASELTSKSAKLCLLKASVKPWTLVGNNVLEVIDNGF